MRRFGAAVLCTVLGASSLLPAEEAASPDARAREALAREESLQRWAVESEPESA